MKLADEPGLVQFLDDTIVATLAVQIDTDGTLHIATLHYVHQTNPLSLYFVTDGNSEKCKLMRKGGEVKAACTVGTVVDVLFGLQMRGTASILPVADNPDILDKYFTKRKSTNRNVEGEDAVIVRFVPNWARYTDYRKGWDATMLDLA